MATLDYYKLKQGGIPQPRHGSNWWWIRVDFSKIVKYLNVDQVAAADVLKLAEIKSGSILKCGFTRVTVPANGAATMDIETTSGGDEIDAAVDIDSATDTWLRTDTLDDDGPITITSDDYIYATINSAACVSGVIDILLEVVIAGSDDIDRYSDSLAEAN
jgi:hypothetical protein